MHTWVNAMILPVADIRRLITRCGNWSSSIAAIILACSLMACDAGNGLGLDENGHPLTSSAGYSSESTLVYIQDSVFTPSCAMPGCHGGSSPILGLRLEESYSFDNLVNQASVQIPTMQLVIPGDPDNSYLVQKLDGTAASGQTMPLNQPVLSQDLLSAVRIWVEAGAIGPRLSSIQENLFTPRCTSCHSGSSPTGGLNLEQGQSYAGLVGADSHSGSKKRVLAGDVEASFLIDKLEDDNLEANLGGRMPLGGPYLDQSEIDVIIQWIDAGAEDIQGMEIQ